MWYKCLLWDVWKQLTALQWASYQIRKNAGCACAGNVGNGFPHRRLQRKPLVSDPGMHHDTCVTHVPWCMPGSLIHCGGQNVPGIPGACATRNFTYLARGPWTTMYKANLGIGMGVSSPFNFSNPGPLTLVQIPHLRHLVYAANSAYPHKNPLDLARVMCGHIDTMAWKYFPHYWLFVR